MWPQVILILLQAIAFGVHCAKHGQPQSERKYNWWAYLIGAILITNAFLWWGGWFNPLIERVNMTTTIQAEKE